VTSSEPRRWVKDQPTHEPTLRRWVVWGDGDRFPDAPFAYGAANDVAEGIVRSSEDVWRRGWLAIVEAEESVIDEWATEHGARFAPYLVGGKTEEAAAAPMSGTLRSDVAPRRKADQPRPS
jgi:hypothetical protein